MITCCRLTTAGLFATLIACGAAPSGVAAQTRSETISQAKVAWLDQCLFAAPHVSMGKGEGVFTDVIAKLAGDFVGAGVNALGEALEAASQEHAFSAAGLARFNFYELAVETHSNLARIRPRSTKSQGCLVLSLKIPGGGKGLDTHGDALKSHGLDESPHLYLETRLVSDEEGFYVQPVYFAYLAPIPGAPKKSSAVELHLSFAVPAAANENGGRGSIFALAQISLPKVAPSPDTYLDTNQLRAYGSAVLPLRSREPLESLRAQVQSALSGPAAAEDAVQSADRSLTRARLRLEKSKDADPKSLAALRDLVTNASEAVEDRALERDAAEAKRESMLTSIGNGVTGGVVTAHVRVSVIRDANKFGLTVSRLLKARSAEFGGALATHLTPAPQAVKPAWTEKDTALVAAMSAVTLAEHALTTARASGDTSAIIAQEVAVRNARASANQAAAAAGQPLPFPDLRA